MVRHEVEIVYISTFLNCSLEETIQAENICVKNSSTDKWY